MSKKKFSIPNDLASGIRNSINTGSTNRGQLHYELMDINVIVPDSNNPRQLILTKEDIKNGLNSQDPQYKIKQALLESLQPLADSIKKVGVRNAIEVYKEGQSYRIISGERRFLASLIAEKSHIPVRINTKPDEFKLRYLQWIENIQREDLSLWEKYINLTQLVKAYTNANNSQINIEIIGELLSVSTTQAYKYMSLLSAPNNILQLIENGKLNSLKLYYEFSQISNPALQSKIIQKIVDSTSYSETELIKTIREIKKVKHVKTISQEKRGRPSQHIKFGNIEHKLAKKLIEIIIDHESLSAHRLHFSKIDWSSGHSVNQAFRNLINIIESMTQ